MTYVDNKAFTYISDLQAKQNILEFQVTKTKKKLKKQLDDMKIINGIN